MKTTLLSLTRGLSALALIFSAPAFAEVTNAEVKAPAPIVPVDADPALWVVKDDDTTIYLFGTVHILKPGLSWFDEAVKDAFDKSDTLVLEIVEPSAEQAQREVGALAADRSGKPLRGRLNVEQQKTYDAAMTKLGMPVTALDPVKPWFGGIALGMADLVARGYDVGSGVEVGLTKAAKASKKPIIALETFSGQLQIFDSISSPSQIEFLMSAATSAAGQPDEMRQLVDLWAKPDPEGLATLMNEGLENGELRNALLTKRNANWASWINQRMAKPGTIFIAVGAGHLSGVDSVPALLKAYKIQTERVVY